MPPITLLDPGYLYFLPALQYTLIPPTPPDSPLMAPTSLHPLGDPQCPSCLLYPFWSMSTYIPYQPPNTPLTLPTTPDTHLTPHNSPSTSTPLGDPQCPLMPPIPLLVVKCHHFATDCLHAVKMLIFYHCHFQLSSICN